MITSRSLHRLLPLAAFGVLLLACSPSALLTNLQQHQSADAAANITAFSIVSPFAAGTINGNNIAVTVPFGTNVLVAQFATSGVSVRVGTTFQVSGVTSNDFSSPITYTVTAVDSSTMNYTVTVTVSPLIFAFTGSQQNFLVPPGITRVRMTLTGAAGGLGAIAPAGSRWTDGRGAQRHSQRHVFCFCGRQGRPRRDPLERRRPGWPPES